MASRKKHYSPFASLIKKHDGYCIRFERPLEISAEMIWNYLTDPQYLKLWLGEGSINQSLNGIVKLTMMHNMSTISGRVTHLSTKHEIEYTWKSDEAETPTLVEWEVQNKPSYRLLILKHRQLTPQQVAGQAAIWHNYLTILEQTLKNPSTPFKWSEEEYKLNHALYTKMYR